MVPPRKSDDSVSTTPHGRTDKIVRVPGLVNASSVVDFAAFKNDDVYKAGPDLGGHDSEMIGGAARGARLGESL